jgi:hypothetical protein
MGEVYTSQKKSNKNAHIQGLTLFVTLFARDLTRFASVRGTLCHHPSSEFIPFRGDGRLIG